MKTKYFEYNRNGRSEKYSEFTEEEYLKALNMIWKSSEGLWKSLSHMNRKLSIKYFGKGKVRANLPESMAYHNKQ
nr:hypothetical protein [Ruminococcus bicirculans (ex Wegman et al. 2014)]